MRAVRNLTPVLVLSCLALGACNDKGGGDTGSGGGGGNYSSISGTLSIEVYNAVQSCVGNWSLNGSSTGGSWCPDCTMTFDTSFSLSSSTGSCDYEDFDREIGYFPNYSDGYAAIVYPYGGSYYYWGWASLSGSSLSWVQYYYGYTNYGDDYSDYFYVGNATLHE